MGEGTGNGTRKTKGRNMFVCLECGKKFKSVKAAEKAANNGCPKCGGVDIDVNVSKESKKSK